MRRDSKLFAALHILAHLAAAAGRPLTSEELAACLETNPVVVRRSLAGLREAGIVASTKGHGGGWALVRPPASISLRDVYVALGEPGVLAPVPEPDVPGCLIEAAVAQALDGFYAEAEALLLRRLEAFSLADLSVELQRRLDERMGVPSFAGAAPERERAGADRPENGAQG